MLRWGFYSLLAGILAGGAASIFLHLLEWATHTRESSPNVIWLLPFGGFLVGWIYWRMGNGTASGSNLILDEIHNPRKVVPFRMAPFVMIGTIATHFFGGSAGREGTAVQMGATLADQLSAIFNVDPSERRILLVAGAGAGFGAAIGAPFAGVIFGMEVISVGRLRIFAFFECFVASFAAYFTTIFLLAPHWKIPVTIMPIFDWSTLLLVGVVGVLFGFCARIFILLTHLVEKVQERFVSYPPLRPFLGGLVLLAIYHLIGNMRYAGLGLPIVDEALVSGAGFIDPALKALVTAITIGSGFKGGEFIPLVFIGATFGSALGGYLPVSFELLAAVGVAAVFAGAVKAPIACTIMAIELFGWPMAPYAALGCLLSSWFSGRQGVYSMNARG